MYGEGESFKQSVAKTNKLFCSDCNCKIEKGTTVVFRLDSEGKMIDAYCEKCGENYAMEVASERHIFDLED